MEQDPFLKREELAHSHQLGALQQEYTIRFGRSLIKYGILILIPFLIVMIVIFVSGDVPELSVFVSMLGVFVLGGGFFGGALYYYRQLHVYVYTDGLLYLNGAKSRVARWEQISRVGRDSESGNVTLWMKNERRITLLFFIDKLGELYSTIEREIAYYPTPDSALAEDSQRYAAIQQTPFTVGAVRVAMKVFRKVIVIIWYTVVILLGLGTLALLILVSILGNFPYTLAYGLRHHQNMSVIIALGFVGLVFGYLGVLFLYLSVRTWRDQFKLRRDGVRVEGRITRHPDNYYIRYSYDYQGQTYSRGERVSEKYSGTLSEGTPVPVLCVAHDPTVARVADPTTGSIVNNQGSSIVITLGHGVMFFGLTIWLVWLLLTALTTRVP